MVKADRNVYIVALIAVVNMLGYGIIIPILYAYSKKFGLSDFQNGLLFATFSICQFISTPIIGRMSDKYGRRPLLLISILGTAGSFFMMAFAPNWIFLFLARALDGLTAGNIPVIFAVISDSTSPVKRTKAFGIVGAAFSFGFIFGPATAAMTVGLGAGIPFIVAGLITLVAVIITALFLPETNQHLGEVKKGKLFDFPKLWHTLFEPKLGVTFIYTMIYNLAFACAILYGFQPFTINVLKLTERQNALLFTFFGIVGLLTQTVLVAKITKYLGTKRAFTLSTLLTSSSFLLMFMSQNLPMFLVASAILGIFNSIAQTLIPTILSQEADAKSQGSIMGLNASYQSIGMIFGPILGGMVATMAIPLPFAIGSGLVLVCFFLSLQILKPSHQKESAF